MAKVWIVRDDTGSIICTLKKKPYKTALEKLAATAYGTVSPEGAPEPKGYKDLTVEQIETNDNRS